MKQFLTTLFGLLSAVTLGAQTPKVITLAPYLQSPSDGGVTLMWQTSGPAHCRVEYGEASADDPEKIAGTPKTARDILDGQVVCNTTVHRVRLQGLESGKTYLYRILAQEILEYRSNSKVFGASDSTGFHRFRLPGPGDTDFTAVIFNDLHKNSETFQTLCGVIRGMDYDFAVFNGDCINDPANREEATAYIRLLNEGVGASGRPVFYIRGNHETRNAYSVGLREILDFTNGKTYGAFSWGDTRFVLLDCGEDKPDDHREYSGLNDFTALRQEQAGFLKQETASPLFREADKRVLIHHIPLYGVGDRYRPCTQLWGETVAKAKFDVAVNGHTHRPARLRVGELGNNFPVYVGGSPKLETATVTILEKKGRILKIRMLGSDGQELFSDTL